MSLPSETPRRIAEQFISPAGIIDVVGAGTDGTVFMSSEQTVVKVHLHPFRFRNELSVYQRLAEHGINRVGIFRVPELRSFDESLRVIEISAVEPPFLIDFGKSRLLEDWEDVSTAEFEAKFEREFSPERAAIASQVFSQLKNKYGVLHLDMSPYNLNFGPDED